jgi:hypothetical protein
MMALACLSAWQGATAAHQTALTPQHVAGAVRGWAAQHDSRVPALAGLSVLELCMLVAAQRLEDAGQPTFNFQVRRARACVWLCVFSLAHARVCVWVCGRGACERHTLRRQATAPRARAAPRSCARPQMVLDEFMSVKQMQLGFMWRNKAAAWRAFKDVVDSGLISFTATRCKRVLGARACVCVAALHDECVCVCVCVCVLCAGLGRRSTQLTSAACAGSTDVWWLSHNRAHACTHAGWAAAA